MLYILKGSIPEKEGQGYDYLFDLSLWYDINFIKIGCGNSHIIAVTRRILFINIIADNQIYGWGEKSLGRLGINKQIIYKKDNYNLTK